MEHFLARNLYIPWPFQDFKPTLKPLQTLRGIFSCQPGSIPYDSFHYGTPYNNMKLT
jgi:hypothetical protein